MYSSFFGLNEKPFSITPDPRYLFMSERHGEALAHLVYGVTESGGFIQLTGEVGTGKTTLCRTLLLNRMPDNADVAVVLNPQLSALEFLEVICEELGISLPEPRGSIKTLIDTLNRYLLDAHAEGRRAILIVDEAQNLAPDVLEQVRLLTNLETAKQKLLQIILIGQPELRELLARNDLRQLAQRITGRYHLEPLSRAETAQYIEHRLRVAGALGEVFAPGAKRDVFCLSKGVPRLINVICDRALLGAYSLGTRRVDHRLVRRAAAEITGESGLSRSTRWVWPAVITAVLAVAVFGTWWLSGSRPEPAETQPAALAMSPEEALPDPAADSASIEPPSAAIERDVSPASAETTVSVEEQLLLARDLTGEAAALDILFELWGLDYVAGGSGGCEQAELAGLSCLSQRGSWGSLRQLNRPAMLTLIDGAGSAHYVVLKSLEGNEAELSVGGVDVMHSIGEISNLWFGQYALLWRPANGVSLSLNLGSRGPTVAWLRQSLAAIDPRYAARPLDSATYDAALADRVREFQRDHRLDVDGVAGQQTQIIVNSLLAPDGAPRLITPRFAQE